MKTELLAKLGKMTDELGNEEVEIVLSCIQDAFADFWEEYAENKAELEESGDLDANFFEKAAIEIKAMHQQLKEECEGGFEEPLNSVIYDYLSETVGHYLQTLKEDDFEMEFGHN